ncbi:Putative ATP-dependent DNA helicase YjcD [Stieleria neptunia]|uniref:DNA 3'-5' helicase n=1 Tax=Stieleria neptunia TaxID=2527979 RepID=A0A518HY68_9BACT|nr:3'-5' exonuclease [Stieleria neptunia]QDV45803.1 Putative ATP-dependent DNA helicase YjcD [Stieleria neptunia]
MEFRISDTFTDSLTRLTGDEQKSVKTTAFDLQIDPVNPGMQFHRIHRCKDPNFWSVRAGRDIRVIVHKTDASLLLCYVGHHDAAYAWAERRRIERHPRTGAAQLVEVRETVREIEIPKYVEQEVPAPTKTALLRRVSADDLLGYGVPPEWIDDVLAVNEDTLFDVADRLPREAAEAVLDLATGETPPKPVHASEDADPFAHPDAISRFRVMADVEQLRRALDAPWDKWAVFLHPSQESIVSRTFKGPARVCGSAGTGKTIVALHRAAHVARQNSKARVLLTTFSDSLAANLRRRLKCLVGEDEPSNRIVVKTLPQVARELLGYEPAMASEATVEELIGEAGRDVDRPMRFLMGEWATVVDGWQVHTWDEYRDVPRLGRRTRLGEPQRKELWTAFEKVLERLSQLGQLTEPMLLGDVTDKLASGSAESPYDFVIVDEAQDISVSELRFVAALTSAQPAGLFFAGDLGQRIFQAPFSWKSLGVDIRGRSQTLKINYRTSHQIRTQADRLLPNSIADVDGNAENRGGTISVFNGPKPSVTVCDCGDDEIATVAAWITGRQSEGVARGDICLIVRSSDQTSRASSAAAKAGLDSVILDSESEPDPTKASIATMHEAKGLEFRAVIVMACDDEVLPLQERIESAADTSELEEVYNTERHLLYVACTRARDHLLITAVDPASEFLDDFIESRNN